MSLMSKKYGPCAFGAISVAAAHELEYEAQSGMQTRSVRSMIRMCSWDSVPLSINTTQLVITSTVFESVLGYIEIVLQV